LAKQVFGLPVFLLLLGDLGARMLVNNNSVLPRAGVLVGLICIFFTFSFFYFHYEKRNSNSDLYLSKNLLNSVNELLTHITDDKKKLDNNMSIYPKCSINSSNYDLLHARVDTFNHLLENLSKNGFLKKNYKLDEASWLSDSNQRSLSCMDIVKPLNWLLHQTKSYGVSYLETLTWKERQSDSHQIHFKEGLHVSINSRQFSTKSPWRGVPGCIFWTNSISGLPVYSGSTQHPSAILCKNQFLSIEKHGAVSDEKIVLPGLSQIVTPLSSWRLPHSDLYQRLIGENNQIYIKGQNESLGIHIQLGIDPNWQNKLQTIIQCFSGSFSNSCKYFDTAGAERFESARVRMAGVAIVDVRSGRVIVAASSSSACFEHDKTRLGPKPDGCPMIPEGNVHHPQVPQPIVNHAIFTQAPPGSLVKPIIMAGILRNPSPKGSLIGIEKALQRSDSQRFLDAMLCRQRLGSGGFEPNCERPQKILETIHQIGWNSGCDSDKDWDRNRCGMIDLLRGIPLAEKSPSISIKLIENDLYKPIQLPILSGQLMVEPMKNSESGWGDMQLKGKMPSTEQLMTCSKLGKKGYVRCGGSRMALISEGYGQGNSMTTPVGVAGMFSTLASSAQGLPAHYPRIVIDYWNSKGGRDQFTNHLLENNGLPSGPDGINLVISRQVLSAMETTHTVDGSAFPACKKVMGEDLCNANLGIAGKTGTPGDTDERSLAQLVSNQSLYSSCLASGKENCLELHPSPRPRYRWYAAVFKSVGSDQYDKAIAVLVHSNWRRSDGRYADESNAAAEIAFLSIKHIWEMQKKK